MRQGGRVRATVGRRWPIVLSALLLLVPGTPQLLATNHAQALATARANREQRHEGNAARPAAGGNWTYSFSVLNELLAATDPLNQGTSWLYLGLPNDVTAKFAPDNSQWQYEYDADSRMTRSIDPTGDLTTYAYDAAGNLIH